VKEAYIRRLESVALPLQEDELDRMHKTALKAALDSFNSASFGVPGSSELQVTHPPPRLPVRTFCAWRGLLFWHSLALPCNSSSQVACWDCGVVTEPKPSGFAWWA
jgi:hypothetical protein